MIEIRQATLIKSGQKVFSNLNLKIYDQQNIWLTGANGSGKTSLLEVIAGTTSLYEGEVTYSFIDGQNWEERYQQRKQYIHYIPADAALTHIHQHELFYQQRYYSLGDEFVPLVKDFLGEDLVTRIHKLKFPPSFSIDHLLELKLTRLSNGQQKRVMILKNLALQIPKLLLLDYPFEALDRQSRKDLADFLDHIAKEHGVQLLITDHDSELPSVINHKIQLPGFTRNAYSAPATQQQPSLEFFSNKLPNTSSSGNDQSGSLPISTTDPIVEMRSVTISYGAITIINNLNWVINKGERWALAGKNGSGKTTLFSLIFADHPLAYSQQVYLFGKRRGSGESIWDIKNRINYLGPEQMSYIDPKDKLLRASDYILPLNKEGQEEKLRELVTYFDAESFINKPLRMLSSGQLQLILIIQCFLFQEELLLLDEPFRFLDPTQKSRVTEYLQQHLLPTTTLVMITHDEHDIRRWGKQVMSL